MGAAAWVRRKLEFVQREVLGDPVFRAGVAAIQAQRAARAGYRDLWDAEVRVYSQWGEDGILDFLCDVVDVPRPRVLELGCGDFRECNSRFLAEWRCASVTMVDSRSDLARSVRELPAYWRTTLEPLQEWITPTTVADIGQRARRRHDGLDIISLDIDGNDYWVAQGIDWTDVRVVVVEYQPLFGGAATVSVPRQDDFDRSRAHFSHLYYGASLRSFVDLFRDAGMAFVGTNRVGNNAFFIRDADVDRFPLPLPDTRDLARYTRWRVRESRDRRGRLTHLDYNDARRLIAHLPLVDTQTGDEVRVADC
jgi:YD repeat-containing protein